MRVERKRGCRQFRSFRQRAAAAVMSVLMFLTMLGPTVQVSAAPGDQHTVTFVIENKQGTPVSGVSVLLKDAGGNEIPASSENENEVTFEGLREESTYTYTIDVGENEYEVPEEGTLQVEDRDKKVPVTLYTEAPECSLETEAIETSFGSRVEFRVLYAGDEPVYYQWYSEEGMLEGETSAVLTLDTVTRGGVYCCTVETELSDVVELSATLSVSASVPVGTVDVQGREMQQPWADITAVVSHPENPAAPAPEGEVKFYIDGSLAGSSRLSDGMATFAFVQLGTDERHSIYAEYVSDDQGKYTDARSGEVIYGKVTPEENREYSVSDPDPDTGWYNEENPLIITPISDSGFDQIWNGEAWADQAAVREDSAEGEFDIVLRNSQTQEETNAVTLPYRMDSTAPADINMSAPAAGNFNSRTNTYEIEFSAADETSGVSSIIWYDTNNTPHLVEQDRGGRFIEDMTAEEWKSVRRIEAGDAAGNTGKNTNVGNRFIEISYPEADRIVDETGEVIGSGQCDADSRYFYRAEQIPVSLTMSEDAVAAGGFALYKNS